MTRVYVMMFVVAALGGVVEATMDEGTGYLLGLAGGAAFAVVLARFFEQREADR